MEKVLQFYFCFIQSCPAVRVYTLQNIEFGLEAAAKSFCENEIYICEKENIVKLNKIFLWYGTDFGADEQTILR